MCLHTPMQHTWSFPSPATRQLSSRVIFCGLKTGRAVESQDHHRTSPTIYTPSALLTFPSLSPLPHSYMQSAPLAKHSRVYSNCCVISLRPFGLIRSSAGARARQLFRRTYCGTIRQRVPIYGLLALAGQITTLPHDLLVSIVLLQRHTEPSQVYLRTEDLSVPGWFVSTSLQRLRYFSLVSLGFVRLD